MVGGYIVQMTEVKPGIMQLWCIEAKNGSGTEMAINVKIATVMPKPGDSCWWQGREAYCANDTITLERVGFSYDPRRKGGAA